MDLGPVNAGGGLAAQLVGGHWYRIAGLAPRLRPQLRLHAHRYRGRPWTVIEDPLNGRYHRFDERAARLIRRLDGRLTLDRLWLQLAAAPAADTPSQDDVIGLLGQLHALDLLAPDSMPDLLELARRGKRQARSRWAQRLLNPLALRIPLWDPDRTLTRMVTALGPWTGRRGAWAWALWVLPALLLAPLHARELGSNFAERMLALDNLLLLWLLFPLVKAIHELGHGLAVKLRGGEVHDMGVMLLIFVPIPYVEASAAWAFPDKRDRMLVGAAGMLIELVIAAAAFYLWLWLEPGLPKAMAYNVAMLSSVTTVVFNANPLLRYDGYYVAADALEMPNLAQRAGQWWGRLLQRLLLGRQAPPAEAPAPGETLWLALYGPLSLLYRLFVMFSIAVFVSTQYFAVGVFIALWSLVMTLGQPLLRAGQALRRLGRDGSRGRKGLRTLTLLLALAAAALFGLPLPLHTQVDGVLWLPDSGVLRAGQRGFAQGHAARSGQILKPGDTVVTLHDPLLEARLAVQVAREAAARTRWDAVRGSDPARATQLLPPLQREQAELAHLQERATRLAVGSPLGGRLWLNGNDDLPGQFFKQGAVLGYVVPDAPPVVRVIVEQADADLIRARTQAIRIRLPAAARQDWPAVLRRAVPAASNELPSAALGHQGGGNAATDPRDDSGRRALQTHFELELGLPAEFPYRLLGGRVSVRFDHEPEPLAYRLGRALRRLFLAHFHD